MFGFWKFLKYCFTSKKHNVKGKFILVGLEKSGKSTLLDAVEAYANKNYAFHCKDESEYIHAPIDDQWENVLFDDFGDEVCFLCTKKLGWQSEIPTENFGTTFGHCPTCYLLF